MPLDGSVNGRFLPLLVLCVQPCEEECIPLGWLGCLSPPNRCLSPPQLLEGNFALFCTYTLGFRNEFQNILLAIMVRMALSWSPSGPGQQWDACCGIPWVLPRSWHGMGALWAEGREAMGLQWSAVGTVTEGPLGGGGGRRSCQMSCKGRAGWQEQRGLCSRVKAARDGGDQEP